MSMNFDKYHKISTVFTPSAPIDSLKLFSGRIHHIVRLMDCYTERGRHAALYGERGVGKTSLANVMQERLNIRTWSKVACTSDSDFTSIWKGLFSQIPHQESYELVGLRTRTGAIPTNVWQALGSPEEIRVDDVVSLLSGPFQHWIFVLDEFDRIEKKRTRRLITDVIKGVSDAGSSATLIIVGVAADVDQLLVDHPSIERNLSQIKLPEMALDELEEIVVKGWGELGIEKNATTTRLIAVLSLGFPHYTHLIALHATRMAVQREVNEVDKSCVLQSLDVVLQESQESIRTLYRKATASTQPNAKFKQTLLACALTKTNEYGTFRVADVREPLSRLEGAPVEIQSYVTHIGAFASERRGRVLEKISSGGSSFYRFRSPLLRPYVLMKGMSEGLVDGSELLDTLAGRS